MGPSAVLGIRIENLEGPRLDRPELGVGFEEIPGQLLVVYSATLVARPALGAPLRSFSPVPSQFRNELSGWPKAAGKEILVAPLNMPAHRWVLELEVVFEGVDVYDGSDRETVPFEDDRAFAQIGLLDQGI